MFSKKLITTITSLFLFGISTFAQQKRIGIFDGQLDIGANTKPGSGNYLPQSQQYVISGAGYNIWFDHDEFHYVYKKIEGDFILYTRADFVGWNGVEEHRKIGWMVRKSLDGNSPQINAVEHGDGLTSLQFRKKTGDSTQEIRSKITHANVIQLERKGNTYTMRVAKYGEPFVTEQVTDLDLGNEVYVGLFVGSHNPNVVETGVFKDVRITIPFAGVADQSTQMTLGSNLELMEIATGNREIIYSVPYSIQAPNWTPDNRSLIFNDSKGLLYTFDLKSRKSVVLNTGTIKNNNNDHVLSFDGKMIGLSSNVNQLGGSIIYTVPIVGGIPKQITPVGPSYLHGWSPDGKNLVYCAERNGEFDVYKIAVKGGKEEKLTNTKGLDDGPEYSPDGKYIYFNSVRSGLMQIWRMKPDGKDQEQVTTDDFNNWFAHISPDGKWMVYLSFLKEDVEPGIHPPYKQVYIRLLPIIGGKPKVLAYLYGGQGSINTPSWSPDSKRIAFISNTISEDDFD
ncbi:TolB family protein [Arcticibacter eurypsychrophilus]|uniref:TolB family protein n=1 Tax=Arcticibacter eurypsychrophilus TaxID=1434752 RepID=UPI00084D6BB5|nr:TolB family protein [Arcticibacter eurypsychrophilus]